MVENLNPQAEPDLTSVEVSPSAAEAPDDRGSVSRRRVSSRLTERPVVEWVAVVVVAVVAATLVFRRTLVGGDVLGSQDYHIITVPFQVFIDRSWGLGEVPLWTPNLYFGVPFLANGDTFVFYPLQTFFLALDPPKAIVWQIWLHSILGTITMYALARVSLRVSPAGAAVAALVVVYGGFTLSHHVFVTFVHVLPWTPLLLLCLERSIERSMLWAWLGALAVGLVLLAGLPQLTYYVALWLPWFLAVIVRRRPEQWRARARRAVGATLIAAALGGLLAAVQVVPQAELVSESHRGDGLELGEASLAALPTDLVPTLLLPDYDNTFFGENAAWVGLVASVLAAVGLGHLLWRRRWLEAGLWGSMIVVSAAVATGPEGTPLFELAFDLVPGFDRFRIPSRLLYPLALAVALLAAHGTDRVVGWLRPASVRRTIGVLAGLALAGLVAGPRLLWLLNEWDNRRWIIGATIAGAGLALLAVVLSRLRWLDRSAAVVLLVAAVAVELLGAGYFMEWNEPRSAAAYSTAGRPIPQFLAERAEGRVVSAYPPDSVFTEQIDRIASNTALHEGIRSIGGFAGTWPTEPVETLVSAVGSSLRSDGLEHVPLLRLFGVEYIVARDDQEGLLDSDATEIVLWDEDRVLLRLREPGSRARAYCGAIFVPDEEEILEELVASGVDVDALVLTGEGSDVEGGPCGTVEIVDESNRALTLEADLPSDGWVFVADTWYPGWEATVDGEPVEIEPAMAAFRAVRVPAGSHTVEMTYEAPSFRRGAVLSVVGLVVWSASLLAVVVGRRRRGRARSRGGPPGRGGG